MATVAKKVSVLLPEVVGAATTEVVVLARVTV
jgi:hypothetical protein